MITSTLFRYNVSEINQKRDGEVIATPTHRSFTQNPLYDVNVSESFLFFRSLVLRRCDILLQACWICINFSWAWAFSASSRKRSGCHSLDSLRQRVRTSFSVYVLQFKPRTSQELCQRGKERFIKKKNHYACVMKIRDDCCGADITNIMFARKASDVTTQYGPEHLRIQA